MKTEASIDYVSSLEAAFRVADILHSPLVKELCVDLPYGPLTIRCDNEAAVRVLQQTFRHYLASNDIGVSDGCALNIYYVCEQAWSKLRPFLLVTNSTEEADYFTWKQGRGVIIHGSFALFMPDDPEADICLIASNRRLAGVRNNPAWLDFHSNDPEYFADWLMVADIAKGAYACRAGVYCLHAALLERDGKGVLVVGESGAGKTTTALALGRAGFTLMTDDIVFLSIDKKGDVNASGLLMSPNFVGEPPNCLEDLEATLGQSGCDKRTVNLDRYRIPVNANSVVKPELVLLLEKHENRTAEHEFLEVDWNDALVSIMNQVMDPLALFRRIEHLTLISKLNEQCSVKRLIAGWNLKSLVDQVELKLEQVQCH